MGFDPVSLGVMAAGTGLSMLGSGRAAGSKARNDAAQAYARNQVLKAQNAKLDSYAATNRGDFNTDVAAYGQPQQEAQLAGAQGSRAAASDAAVDAAGAGSAAIPTGFSSGQGGNVAKADLDSRMNTQIGKAREAGRAGARLRGYDDSLLSNNLRDNQLARNIDTTNNFARGTAALTPALQDFAQFQAYKAPSMWNSVLQGAGSLLSSYGANSLGAGTTPFASLGKSLGGLFGNTPENTAGLTQYPAANVPLPRPRPASI